MYEYIPMGMGRTGANRSVKTAFTPSRATTRSIPRNDGYSSSNDNALVRMGESILAMVKATVLPIVAAVAEAIAPGMTPPNSIPDAKAKMTPPASKQSTFTAVHPAVKSNPLVIGSIVSAVCNIYSKLSFNSGLSDKKSNPTALTSAARPPIRKTIAPTVTTNAVNVTATFPSSLMGFPVTASISGI